jgi:hypothetical protein
MNLPSSSDAKVEFGGTILLSTLTPFFGTSVVDFINRIATSFSGSGFKEVFVGKILSDILHVDGLLVLSHISAVKYSFKKFEIVKTFVYKLTPKSYGFTKAVQAFIPFFTHRISVWPTK